MMPPCLPADESERLSALVGSGLLDTPAEERFDRLTRIARRALNVPIALVSLIDAERQWFKSAQGLEASETSRDISFCGHAILAREIFEVEDARKDPRFHDNPLVTGPPFIRFYAGRPLVTATNHALGTLCLLGDSPRRLDDDERRLLEDLASCVEEEINQRALEAVRRAHRDDRRTLYRFKQVLEHTTDGVLMFDAHSLRFLYANPGACQLLGKDRDTLLALHPHDLMPEVDEAGFRARIASLVAGDRSVQTFETSYAHQEGTELHVEVVQQYISPVDAPPFFIAIVRDISERRRIERMKNEFVSMVSHELRTPLTSISGALGLLAGGIVGELSVPAREMVDIAQSNSKRLTFLINDLLDMEKLSAGKMHFDLEVQPLRPLIHQAVESLRAFGAQREVTIALVEPMPEVAVEVDAQRLIQVLNNLLSNALKFSPPGGRVELAVTLDDVVRVSIKDNGPGIPAAFRNRLFEKFAQADGADSRRVGGTGLGLAISRGLVERMHGGIGVHSVEGEGACFYFTLPRAWGPQPERGHRDDQARETMAPAGLPNGIRGGHILVIEDDPDVARLLAGMLERAGHTAEVALTGTRALERLEQQRFDAVTLDLVLPDMDGLSIIRRLRGMPENAELPIVVVSGKVREGGLDLRGEFHKVEWLSKPLEEHNLVAVTRHILHQAGHSQPRVLHVEDDADLQRVVSALVGDEAHFESVASLREARALVALERFDVVLLDIDLPDGSGWALVPDIRVHQPDARLVIMTGREVSPDEIALVDSVLLKSRASQEDLLSAIGSHLTIRLDAMAARVTSKEDDGESR